MKKVLIFGMTDTKGGMESCIMNYYRNVDSHLIHFDFLCNFENMAYYDEIVNNGSKVYFIPKRSENPLMYYKAVNDFFKKHASEYDALWFNTCSLANIDYLKYAKKYGIKKRIVHAHNSQNMDSKLRGILHQININIVNQYATDFWTCSKGATKFFYSKNPKIKNIQLINNAIDLDQFTFDELTRKKYRDELGIDENTIIIGHVGRFHFQKNHDYLIEIFKSLYSKNSQSILLLIGIGEEKERIENLVKANGLQDVVIFLGERNDVTNWMQAMDVFLFPSLFEGLGMVLIEAQASGLLTFASSDDIPKEAKICDLLTFIKLSDSPDTWADTIMNTLKNRPKNIRTKYNDEIKSSQYSIKVEKEKLIHLFYD